MFAGRVEPKIIESRGRAIIRKGEYGKIIPHNVEELRGHKLKACITIVSFGLNVGMVMVGHILHKNVLILLVYSPETGECIPAPCDIAVDWYVYNVEKRRL